MLAALAVAVLAAGATLPGCAGCRGAAPLSFVPQDALAVLVVPSLRAGLKEAKMLLDKFRDQMPVKLALDQGKKQLEKELGVDPERPETLKGRGVNPDAGLAASVASDGKSTAVVFGVADGALLDKALRELSGKVFGGGVVYQEKVVDGVKVTVVTSPGAENPQLAWAEVKKHLILCPAAKGGKLAEHVARIAKLETSIKDNKTYAAVIEKLGKHQAALYVDGAIARKVAAAKAEEDLRGASDWNRKFIKERQEATQGMLAYLRGAALSLRVSAEGLVLRGYLGVTPEKGKTVGQLLKGNGDAAEFGKYIGPDALAVVRFSLNVKKLLERIVEAMPPGAKRGFYGAVERLEREAKLSVERDVLSLLSNRFAGALFAPGPEVVKSGMPRSAGQLAGMVPSVLMVQVTDSTRASDLLAKLERVLVMAQVDVRTRAEGDRRVYLIEDEGKPLLSWTVVKDVAVLATGDRLSKTVSLITEGGDNVLGQLDNSRAKSLLKSEDGAVLYYNISKTADLVRAMDLPAEIKAILSTPLATISKLNDTMIDFEVDEGGVLGELLLGVK